MCGRCLRQRTKSLSCLRQQEASTRLPSSRRSNTRRAQYAVLGVVREATFVLTAVEEPLATKTSTRAYKGLSDQDHNPSTSVTPRAKPLRPPKVFTLATSPGERSRSAQSFSVRKAFFPGKYQIPSKSHYVLIPLVATLSPKFHETKKPVNIRLI